jgi:cytochrome oxidase Cu insertion factor (SCO1/SenC/PrrC family)/mono/diheme cytochrome c family protein
MDTQPLKTLIRAARLPLTAASLVLLVAGVAHWFKPGSPLLNSANAASPPAAQAALKGTGDEVWGANYFPNVKLTDQDGKTWRFFDDMIKGRVVSINFIFTSCSSSCGLETARLREVQQLLGERLGKDVFFYSISIDPLTDTPAELKKYATKFGADLPGWRFLTGSEADITLIRRKLGMYEDDEDKAKNQSDHVLHTMLGNQATGRWMKGSPYEDPAFTANQLGSWLHNYKFASPKETRFENAPTYVRTQSDGEKLFRHRCSSCHTLDGSKPGSSARAIGPDLDGLSKRRPRAWLERWLREPDRMLADKDPIATAMFNQYNKVAMPNLKLDAKDIDRLLSFIDEESALPMNQRRVARQ